MALSGEYMSQDMKEFTIRYAPDTQVKLRAAGKTLLISIVQDSIHMEEVSEMRSDATAMVVADEESETSFWAGLFGGDDEELEVEEAAAMSMMSDDSAAAGMEEEDPWYKREWQMIGAVGLIIAFVLMAWLVLRNRLSGITDGLDEFEDEEEY